MLKRYTFWFSAAILFQLLTGIFTGKPSFVSSEPSNETESQLQVLTTSYRMNRAGSLPCSDNLFTLSVRVSFYYVSLRRFSNGYLLCILSQM